MTNLRIAVIGGCGRIGLPLSISLSLVSNNEVIPIDINNDAVSQLNEGKYPYHENNNLGSKYLKTALSKGLRFTTEIDLCSNVDCIILATGKISDDDVDFNKVITQKHFEMVLNKAKKGTFIIIRSTISVGTMQCLLEKINQFYDQNDGQDQLAYCPERLSESNSFDEITTLPQLVSTFSDKAFKFASDLFIAITPSIVRLEISEAEYAKLLTNAWRYIEFAAPNHFYSLLEGKVDFNQVLDAIKHEYPRASGYRRPGLAAGPCLRKDSEILTSYIHSGLCDLSIATNEGLPNKLIDLLATRISKPLSQSKIGILGLTFKANTDDTRDSLSVVLKDKLNQQCLQVLWNDPYLTHLPENVSIDTVLNECDAFIIATPHKEYENLKLPNKPFVDTWGLYSKPLQVVKNKVTRSLLSQGRPTILVTGSAGFIAGYAVQELLNNNYHVIGIDNYSKYGPIKKDYDDDEHYEFHIGDAKDINLMKKLALKCDYVLACGAMIGGISYFHEFAYDLLAENERVIATTFDAAIHAYKFGFLKKIIVLSSSMVFESSNIFPTPESEVSKCAPPLSTYGFQKLACEYYAKGAYEQYQLPYTIVRPFNAVGLGERRALCDHEIMSGNVKLAMSHVVPDLMQKVLKGQNPLHILGSGNQIRHYTYGGDLARGIRICIEHPNAINNDFNISTSTSTTVLSLAETIWKKHYGDSKPFSYICDEPFVYDVQCRVPDCTKAKELLGYEATTTLDEIIEELFPWIASQIEFGNL